MNHGTVATRANLDAVEDLYRRWCQDRASVDPSWQSFFEGFELGLSQPAPSAGGDAAKQIGIVRLVFAYRSLGHFLANLDPLSEPRSSHPLLELSEFELSEADMDRTFDTPFLGLPKATLGELLTALRETYCRTLGVEYMHIQDTRIRRWLQERLEIRRSTPSFDRDQKLRILKHLYYADLFEKFLDRRYPSQKRFSLEGAETLIPLLEALVEKASGMGVSEIVMGMAHRGRLNVLANTLRKPYEEIFAQFEENYLPDSMDGDGDVKYHLGFATDRKTPNGKRIHLSLTPNPSHLEAVDPVVEGRTRAKQTRFHDAERNRGISLLIHGDAAFAGQGLVAETLNLCHLTGYTTGGTVHVIVNNQIGFTTAPSDARSTAYCTDVAKMIQVPIFHVNSEDPEATVWATELAMEFRQTFHRDAVVDMFCYRRLGHNEGDDPSFTQPLMYAKIRGRPTVTKLYTERLKASGDLSETEIEALRTKFEGKLQEAQKEVKAGPAQYPLMHGYGGLWKGLDRDYTHAPVSTGVDEKTLLSIANGLVRTPETFQVHPTIGRILSHRKLAIAERKPFDWPQAELLAFGTLLVEGTPVRLSGQDSRRGTFSQRHSVLYDVRTGEPYSPLNYLSESQAKYCVYDSLLSESAVLGFEYGYALEAPGTLVLWEAQFGDFANGAQVIIDQFLASSESKWRRDSGLVLLLPHGYEGQGPEHSSARLERYLQLCAEDNIQVAYPSTPAQYFHLLRRQMKRNFRKPLVVMTPKSLLRLPACVSPVEEFATGRFREILDDSAADPGRVRKVLLCSGKVFYELADRRKEERAQDIAILRVEQFYPLNEELLRQTLGRYSRATQFVWVQEESQNMGAWTFMEPRLRALGDNVEYVGRDASASPATGSLTVHKLEQQQLVEAAIHGPYPYLVRAGAKPRPVPAANGDGKPAERPAVASSV